MKTFPLRFAIEALDAAWGMDQALTGRTDGENYQIGFVTVADAPYPELVQAARDVAATMYPRRFESR